jgi:hypothetical protein
MLAFTGVVVESSVSCPERAMIEQRLVSLVGERGHAAGLQPVIRVNRDAEHLWVTLLGPEGNLLERRVLPTPVGSCELAAEDVAIVIAAMLAEFQPGWTATFPPPAVRQPVRLRSLTAAVGPAWAGDQTRPAWQLSLEAMFARAPSIWSMGGGLLFETGESTDFSGGQVYVQRLGGVLGLMAEAWQGSWGLAARGHAGAALITVSGQGFAQNHTSLSVDAVVATDVILRLEWGRVGIDIGPAVDYWLRPQAISVRGSTERRELPALAFLLRVAIHYRAGH